MVVNFSSADWPSENPVEGVCGSVCGWSLIAKQENFQSAVLYSRMNFFARSRHFKELQLKGNLFDCPQIWTVARLTYENKRVSGNCLFRNIFSPRAIFARSLHIF